LPRHSLVDRVFYGAVAVLILILAVCLLADSVENRGFEFGLSFRMLMLAIVTILGFFRVLRRPVSEGADDETRAEEL
jgi:hypothetical protein